MNEITPVTPWLNTAGAAEYLATTEDAIRGLVKRGRLPVCRTETGRLLFRPEELDAWVRGELTVPLAVGNLSTS